MFGENFIDIWDVADFGPYTPQSFILSIYIYGSILFADRMVSGI
jgi:hypothetical protein